MIEQIPNQYLPDKKQRNKVDDDVSDRRMKEAWLDIFISVFLLYQLRAEACYLFACLSYVKKLPVTFPSLEIFHNVAVPRDMP